MNHQEGTFKSSDGLDIFYQSWHPDGQAKATLAIIHGLGEHSGRYTHVIDHFVPLGYAIYGLDHRGHGRSPGQRGFIKNFGEFRQDVHTFVQLVSQQETGRPLFLWGHSMGGLITLNYGLHHPAGLQGVIASAPAVGTLDIPPILLFISRALNKIYPSLGVATGLDATAISRNPADVAAYQADPLVHGQGTPRLAMEMYETAQWTQAQAAHWQLPLLMIHGDSDRLVHVDNGRSFFAAVPQPDKQMIVYEGGYHEPHNDIDYRRVLADVETWLNTHQ